MSPLRGPAPVVPWLGGRTRTIALVAACALAAGLIASRADSEQSDLPSRPHAGVRAPSLTGSLTVQRVGAVTIPRSFFGLSTEYWTLPVDLRHTELYRRVISLLQVPGDSPFVLRIGGDSSDHTFYAPSRHRMPTWAFPLTTAFVQRTADVVRTMGVHVILDLNLVTGTPGLAAAWAREAEAVLPRGSIAGFEVGNEPDLYERTIWMRMTGERPGSQLLPRDITATSYASDFGRYARALDAAAPRVPLLGPALSHPRVSAGWISTLLRAPHEGLGVISVHEYPFSACAFPGTPSYPSIGRVLSNRASAGLAASVHPAAVIAHRAGLPLRVTEFNSVTCGGKAGVSNTFATALWAPDAGFELLKAGAQSIDLHARQNTVNGPFSFNAGGLAARPLLYGLIMFVRTLSPHAQLLRSQLHLSGPANVKAWAVGTDHRALNVLVLDKGPRGIHLTLNLPATGPAVVQRLLAPGPRSRGGVTLDGQRLNRDGAWIGRRVTSMLPARRRRYHLWVPRYSAALVTVPLASTTSAHPGLT